MEVMFALSYISSSTALVQRVTKSICRRHKVEPMVVCHTSFDVKMFYRTPLVTASSKSIVHFFRDTFSASVIA